MPLRLLAALFLAVVCAAASAAEPAIRSAHAIVVDEATGEVLLQKDVDTPAPIASLTKLFTAMVVLDAAQDPDELLSIDEADLDHLKHTRSGVPVGARATRGSLLELALIASDNHAAAALARNYPGGIDAFREAAGRKIEQLGLQHTLIEEPTGLSPNNRSNAQDMVKILHAASRYPAIADITSKRRHTVVVNGRVYAVRNTNRLVGEPGWNILLSKTGFTNEAGRCVSMRLQAAGRTVMVVLMGAVGSAQRKLDALNIHRWLSGEPPHAVVRSKRLPRRIAAPAARVAKAMQPVGYRSEPRGPRTQAADDEI